MVIDGKKTAAELRQELKKKITILKSTFNTDWCSDHAISIQLSVPRLIFWTKSKNIWVEQRAHPHTILNNFIGIGGWFNLSTWKRGINVSFDILDDKKPVNIKRGDILYELCFYSNDLNDLKFED